MREKRAVNKRRTVTQEVTNMNSVLIRRKRPLTKSDPLIVPLEVNNNVVVFEVGTGSDVNVMSYRYNEFKTLLSVF